VKNQPDTTTLSWLRTNPGLDALRTRFPQEWESVQDEISAIVARGKPEELRQYLERPAGGNVNQLVRQRMATLAVKQFCLALASGVTQGKLRFNLINGFIAQKLLFAHDLVRKPVSLFWFRLWWPLLWQRQRLMPLVQSRGIYCFYSRPLVDALASLIGARRAVEIAAGDGTLTRFLQEKGVDIQASDDHSWKHVVKYPDFVLRREVADVLRQDKPEVVICSWPPAANSFERRVFETPCVQLYIVISSRLQFASGNWQDYRKQTTFELAEDPALSRLVLPPELEAAVYVFRRKAPRNE
jgi:hypothetical protein